MKPKGPHRNARYVRAVELFKAARGDIEAVARSMGLTTKAVSQDLHRARTKGLLPRPKQDAARWVEETARISDLTVGSRADLFDALGIELVQRIVAECPDGVPLTVYIAGIVKDSYDAV
jgi:hypothetical protein